MGKTKKNNVYLPKTAQQVDNMVEDAMTNELKRYVKDADKLFSVPDSEISVADARMFAVRHRALIRMRYSEIDIPTFTEDFVDGRRIHGKEVLLALSDETLQKVKSLLK